MDRSEMITLNTMKLEKDTARKKSKNGIYPGQYFSVFIPNKGKYGLEKLRIWALFTQWYKRQIDLSII